MLADQRADLSKQDMSKRIDRRKPQNSSSEPPKGSHQPLPKWKVNLGLRGRSGLFATVLVDDFANHGVFGASNDFWVRTHIKRPIIFEGGFGRRPLAASDLSAV